MFNLFKDFRNQTQNSMISSYFFSVERYTYSCPNCGIYFNNGMKNLFRINKDITKYYRDLTFRLNKGTNISLYDCLKCYIGGYKKVCKNCGNSNNILLYIALNIMSFFILLYFFYYINFSLS